MTLSLQPGWFLESSSQGWGGRASEEGEGGGGEEKWGDTQKQLLTSRKLGKVWAFVNRTLLKGSGGPLRWRGWWGGGGFQDQEGGTRGSWDSQCGGGMENNNFLKCHQGQMFVQFNAYFHIAGWYSAPHSLGQPCWHWMHWSWMNWPWNYMTVVLGGLYSTLIVKGQIFWWI